MTLSLSLYFINSKKKYSLFPLVAISLFLSVQSLDFRTRSPIRLFYFILADISLAKQKMRYRELLMDPASDPYRKYASYIL